MKRYNYTGYPAKKLAEGGPDWSNPFSGGLKGNLGNTLVGATGAIGNAGESLLSNGYSTGVGNTILGLSSVASAIPGPWGAVASAGLGIIGGGINALFGEKVDQEKLNNARQGTQALSAFQSNASSFDDIQGPEAQANVEDAYKGGLFSKGKAKRKNNALKAQRQEAQLYADRNVTNNINNLVDSQMDNLQANFAAFGGDLLSNGAAWDTGFTYIGNGGSHESNPYEGVPMGVDNQGIPNLVEEGEVVWNDYVFSKRLKVPESFKKKYKLADGGSLSFAEAAEKLSKESKERPNDPISKKGRDAMFTSLMDQQEQVRMKKQQREAKEQFDSMSPEEQLGIMQMAQQYANSQGTAEGQEEDINNEGAYPQTMMAYGGELGNVFKGTGPKSNRMTRRYNKDWFTSRAKALGFDLGDDFTYSNTDYTANLANFNELYKQAQRQKALDTYIKGQRKNWENTELESGRYKKSDDGKSIYKATFYGDDNIGKDYISSDNTRISGDDYNGQKAAYEALKKKTKLTDEEKSAKTAFETAAYKKSPVVKGQFAKDYNGNIIYDYNNDVSSSWTPSNDELGKDFKWDDKDAANIQYDPNDSRSATSYLRYAPALGGAVGVFTDALGITNKPDYSFADAVEAASSATPRSVSFTPVGDYLAYTPLDRNYYLNQIRSSAAASRRAIANQAGGSGTTAMAGILASDYNTIGSMGKLAREAEEYNLGQRERVAAFNRGTNQYNSQGRFEADRANQAAWMQTDNARFNGVLQAAKLRADEQARANAGRSANLTNFLNSLGQIGEEAYDNDRLNSLVQRGVLKDLYKSKYGGLLTKRKK